MKIKEVLKKIFNSYVWLMVVVFSIDIITKWVVEKNVAEFQEIQVIPNFFYITKSYNVGMAFSIGATGELHWRIIFIVISVAFSAGLIFYFVKKYKTLNTIKKIAFALIIGGALGNMIDRAFYWESTVGFNGVIDFLQFYIFGSPFATFNVADASLVIGVFLLIIYLIIEMVKEAIEKKKRGEYDVTHEEYMEKLKQEEQNEQDNNN